MTKRQEVLRELKQVFIDTRKLYKDKDFLSIEGRDNFYKDLGGKIHAKYFAEWIGLPKIRRTKEHKLKKKKSWKEV